MTHFCLLESMLSAVVIVTWRNVFASDFMYDCMYTMDVIACRRMPSENGSVLIFSLRSQYLDMRVRDALVAA